VKTNKKKRLVKKIEHTEEGKEIIDLSLGKDL